MYKNQLQELAQRSCFNLPSYTCIREGPDHAPRFKATVNFNGEIFESPQYCSTLRQAEHSAAEVALNSLSNRGPSHSLAARILVSFSLYSLYLLSVSNGRDSEWRCEIRAQEPGTGETEGQGRCSMNSKPSWGYCITVQNKVDDERFCQTSSVETELGKHRSNRCSKQALSNLETHLRIIKNIRENQQKDS